MSMTERIVLIALEVRSKSEDEAGKQVGMMVDDWADRVDIGITGTWWNLADTIDGKPNTVLADCELPSGILTPQGRSVEALAILCDNGMCCHQWSGVPCPSGSEGAGHAKWIGEGPSFEVGWEDTFQAAERALSFYEKNIRDEGLPCPWFAFLEGDQRYRFLEALRDRMMSPFYELRDRLAEFDAAVYDMHQIGPRDRERIMNGAPS